MPLLALKTDSNNLDLMHAAVVASFISAEIENFLFLHIAHFCSSRTYQMQLMWIRLKKHSLSNLYGNGAL